jgi:poly-beta-1,6-N-acetyl-D-glucosamine synthase
MTKYVIITPVRDEEAYIGKTIESVLNQTIRPAQWIIVNDGSSDRTGEIVDQYAILNPWIKVVHRENRGFRKSGGGVIEAFYAGHSRLTGSDWDFIIKMDGDLSFKMDYYERCFSHFEADSSLGIGSGMVCIYKDGVLQEDSPCDPPFHVRGATKIYRRSCWEKISPLVQAPGWDTIDEVKANMLGWSTRTFRDVSLVQLKATGQTDGSWRDLFKNGRANYITGYHPVFMLAKCVKRVFHNPPFMGSLALWTGFLSGYLKKIKQVQDEGVILYLRNEQIRRITFRSSIYG